MPARLSKTHEGFSLIEILVVLLIIGITLSFALLAFGDFGEKRRVIATATQFGDYVKLIQQQAMIETATLGLRVNPNAYTVLKLDPEGQWRSMPEKSIFHARLFPNTMQIKLRTLQNKHSSLIILQASGDMSPFEIDFGSLKQPRMITVKGTQNGEVTVNVEPSS